MLRAPAARRAAIGPGTSLPAPCHPVLTCPPGPGRPGRPYGVNAMITHTGLPDRGIHAV